MNKSSVILALAAGMLSANVYSQSLESAQQMVRDGKYAEAKDYFERRVKANPSNAANNYWYGVCCAYTGNEKEAVKYLKNAVKRRYNSAYPELAKTYMKLYMFEEAEDVCNDYIDVLKKGKKQNALEEAEALAEKASAANHMLGGVERLNVIDSVVVDKKDFIENYRISPESGKVAAYTSMFDADGEHDGTVYESELGNILLYGDLAADSTMNIYRCVKNGDRWGRPEMLPSPINTPDTNSNYPYLLSDGATIYYASENNSIGGYDIFVTSFNTATNTYLTPQSMGMPFNSPWNDYMLVIDEYSNLGWFASDRFQPEDKVCIYVFVPNGSRNTYNPEETDIEFLRKAAMLKDFRSVQDDDKAVFQGLERLKNTIEALNTEGKKHDFTFRIDDRHTYVNIYDFRSKEAQQMFLMLQQKQEQLARLQKQLDEARAKYHRANDAQRQAMTQQILDMEKQEEVMLQETRQMEVKVRNAEISNMR